MQHLEAIRDGTIGENPGEPMGPPVFALVPDDAVLVRAVGMSGPRPDKTRVLPLLAAERSLKLFDVHGLTIL